MSTTFPTAGAARARALLSAVPTSTPAAALTVRRPGEPLPVLRVGGRVLSREETAAALFEAETDCFGLPGITTDTLYGIAGGLVASMDREEFAELADTFTGLDSGEFWEVGVCREYAYRLHLSFWYPHARTRAFTVGEAAAALCLSNWQRTAGAGRTDTRTVSLAVRQGAASVPTTALMTLGAALSGEFAQHGPHTPVWLRERLLPDYRRRRACFDLIRTHPRIPTPVVVRPDAGGYATGATPPPGPGNRWPRPLRPVW